MPLSCIDPTDADRGILAFDLTDDEWETLADRNREDRFLRMPCCNAQVVLRRSTLGTPHFVHKARPQDCPGGIETEHHFRLKTLVVERARLAGWEADCEVVGQTPGGKRWIADAFARKDGRTVAVEIQWSPQTHEETRRRQRRYAESDVRCLWLMHEARPLRFNDVAIPVAYIDCDEKNDNDYWISLGDGSTMDATSFLDAVFGGRFKFGLPGGRPRLEKMATVELWAAPGECWNEQCRAPMDVLLEIVLSSGNRTVKIKAGLPYWYDNADIENVDTAALESLNPLLLELGIAVVKPRNFHAESYRCDPKIVPATNGCPKCDRIYTCFATNRSRLDTQRQMVGSFSVAAEPWRHVLVEDAPRPRTWHVGDEVLQFGRAAHGIR